MKISIITITYNSEKTLQDTIKSIEYQNYPELEYLIIDGGSTDRTLDIVKKHHEVVSRWISEPDKGISDAFNKGIQMASGDLIGIINSDDLLAENSLKIIAEAIEFDTEVLYGNAIMFGVEENYRFKSLRDLSCFDRKFPIVHPTVFVRKTAYEKYGTFKIKYKCCMDYELLLRMFKQDAKFQYINQDLACMRLGGFNQKNYYKITTKEVEGISMEFGLSPIIAKTIRIYSIVRFWCVNLVRKTPFAKKLRKVFHSRQTDLK